MNNNIEGLPKRDRTIFFIFLVLAIAMVTVILFKTFNANGQVNVTELNTLDRMRYTAIQMTILDLESQVPTNMSNDQIAAEIYKYQQGNENGSRDRLTTIEIESLYRNITSQ